MSARGEPGAGSAERGAKRGGSRQAFDHSRDETLAPSAGEVAGKLAPSSVLPAPCFRHGFTLIEVIAAIAILGLAAVMLGAAYTNMLGAHHAVAQRALMGSNVDFLREVVLNEPERDKVEQGGDVPLPENRQLRWEAEVEEAVVPDLFRVTVTARVSGTKPGEDEEFTQVIMLLRPTWSDPQRREQLRSEWRASREEAAKR